MKTEESKNEYLHVAVAAATAGGEVTLRHFADLAAAGITEKTNARHSEGLVTRADIESEQAIVDTIRQSFPDHQFLAEEEHSSDVDAEHLWIIDPLDGTNNFAHGIPHFAVSVAYYHNGQPRCGVVLNPTNGDVFSAEQGRGAFFNGQPAHVSQHRQLNETMIATGFYYDRGAMMKATLDAIADLFDQNIHGIRRFGAAALDLAYVGVGRFGGFFEFTLSPWDFAAAALFVTEAGGKVSTADGHMLPLQKTTLLATNGHLHSSMLNTLAPHIASLQRAE